MFQAALPSCEAKWNFLVTLSIRTLGARPYGEPFNTQFPEINAISNVIEDGRPIGGLDAGEAPRDAHRTYLDIPPKAAMLRTLEIPPAGGGNNYFADMYAAYVAVPAGLKAAIEGRSAMHDASRNSAGPLRKGYSEVCETVGLAHLLARTNPKTGHRALYLGRRYNSFIVGMTSAESEALLERLWTPATRPRRGTDRMSGTRRVSEQTKRP
jgi:taurine dioxygenase